MFAVASDREGAAGCYNTKEEGPAHGVLGCRSCSFQHQGLLVLHGKGIGSRLWRIWLPLEPCVYGICGGRI